MRLNMQPGFNTMPGHKSVWELECLSMVAWHVDSFPKCCLAEIP